jgi:hypothetical protein
VEDDPEGDEQLEVGQEERQHRLHYLNNNNNELEHNNFLLKTSESGRRMWKMIPKETNSWR